VPPADPEMVFPEYLSVDDPAPVAADRVIEWLADPVARGQVVERLEEIAAAVAQAGSADRASTAVLAIAAGREPALEPTKRAVAPAAAAA
jgi:hypothetical protein